MTHSSLRCRIRDGREPWGPRYGQANDKLMSGCRDMESVAARRRSAASYAKGPAMRTTSAVRLRHTRDTARRSIHLHENRRPADTPSNTGAGTTESSMKAIVAVLALGTAGIQH